MQEYQRVEVMGYEPISEQKVPIYATVNNEFKTFDPKVYAQVETFSHSDIYTLITSVGSNTVTILSRHVVPTPDSASNSYIRDVVGNKSDTVAGNSIMAYAKLNNVALGIVDGYHDVPSADSTANAQMRDVIGNKTDTTSGNSIMSGVKVLSGYHNVPSADSTANAQMRDVIGNKSDVVGGGGDSLMVYAKVNNSALGIIDGYHDVPTYNSVANAQMRDVIGNKTDDTAGDSLYSEVQRTQDNVTTCIARHNVPDADSALNNFIRDVVGNKTDTSGGTSLMAYAKLNNIDIGSNLAAIQTLGVAALETESDANTRYTNIYNRLGAPAGASMSVDIAAIKGVVDAILVDTSATLDGKLNTLGAYHLVPGADSALNVLIRDVVGNKTDTIGGNSIMAYGKKNNAANTDIYNRLGAPAGASMSVDIAAIKGVVDAILVDTSATLDGKLNTIDANVDAILIDTSATLPAEHTSIEGKVDVVDGYHDLPTQNVADNSKMRDVVGNKTDTTAGDSLYSEVQRTQDNVTTCIARHTVPGVNSATNNFIRDVVGQKGDTPAGTSLMAYAKNNNSDIGSVYSKLGTPAGASMSVDIAAIKGVVDAILNDTGTSGVIVASGTVTNLTNDPPLTGGNIATNTHAQIYGQVQTRTHVAIYDLIASMAGLSKLGTGQTEEYGNGVVVNVGDTTVYTVPGGEIFYLTAVDVGPEQDDMSENVEIKDNVGVIGKAWVARDDDYHVRNGQTVTFDAHKFVAGDTLIIRSPGGGDVGYAYRGWTESA